MAPNRKASSFSQAPLDRRLKTTTMLAKPAKPTEISQYDTRSSASSIRPPRRARLVG